MAHSRASCSTTYLVELRVQGTAELHVLHQVGALALIGCDNADLVGLGTRLQQLCGDLLYIGSFRPTKIRRSVTGLPFENPSPRWRL